MHNSLLIRDQLRDANHADVFTRFRDPYRGMTVLPAAELAQNEMLLSGLWRLQFSGGIGADVAAALEADLAALWQRLSLPHPIAGQGAGAGPVLEVRVVEELAPRDARLEVQPERIALSGGGTSGLWAAVSWLAWELRVRRAPVLALGKRAYQAAWALQISQGPLGGNYSVPDLQPEFLSDESFRLYAHTGVNSMMIYGDLLCYSRSSVLPELDHPDADRNLEILREAGERASRYGMGFTYIPVHPKLAPNHPVFQCHPAVRGRGFRQRGHEYHCLCSSDPTALAFYAEQYKRLFATVPQLHGVLAITYSESFYHCDMWKAYELTPCQRCAELETDARVLPLLETVGRAVRDGNPQAFLAEWIYSWPPPDNGGRTLTTIHATRPKGIGVCQAVDKDPLYDGRTVYRKPGYRKKIWDYSLEIDVPTGCAFEAAAAARQQDRIFIAKTETGTGIETMQFPYVPAMFHLARKWEGVRELAPDGVHQAWLFYGHHGSRAERLAAWAAYRQDLPAADYLRQMATADFGPAALNSVLTCWARFGRAIKHLPCLHLGQYYCSPSFFGPCHPLLPDQTAPVPDVFHACLYYLQECGVTFSPQQIEDCRVPVVLTDLPASPEGLQMELDPGLGWELVWEEYAEAAKQGRMGWQALSIAEELLESDADRRNWQEEMNLAELIWRTFLSCANVVRFLAARRRRDDGNEAAQAEMRDVATAEYENTAAALPLYETAPWLDPAVRIDGVFATAAAMIQVKLDLIRAFLAESES